MWQRIKNFFLGESTTLPRTPERIAEERKRYWRFPGQRFTIRGYFGPESVLTEILFLFAVAPGWKLFFYKHNSIDPMPPHNHGGRVASFILWGGYNELRVDGGPSGEPKMVHRRPLRLNWIPLDSYHAIRELPKGTCITFVFVFAPVQEVGYAIKGKFVMMSKLLEEKFGVKNAAA